MRRRIAERERSRALIDGLNALADSLRSGASLRQAFQGPAGQAGSPFHPIATALDAGRPLVPTLHGAMAGFDTDLASACCVLAVHAEAGGDPLPACRALAERIGKRQGSKDEARALTTQSRLGARTILLLTPAFLFLVGISDPGGMLDLVVDPRTRATIATGLVLQGLGAWWITSIVANATHSEARSARIPGLRVLRTLLAGKPKRNDDEDVAAAADITALVLDAGLSPTAGLSAAAPYARGRFGEALREAVSATDVPLGDALAHATGDLGSPSAGRFVRSVVTAIDLGVPLAPSLRVLADDLREYADVRVAEDIRRASIRVLVPLGVLVLPAFVLACLVPLFVGGLEGLAGT